MTLRTQLRNERGFTLIEFIIAFALLTVVLASVYITQGSRLASSVRSRNVLIATNLARNYLNEAEIKLEGMAFDKLDKKTTGEFEAPNEQFKWTQEIEEVDFGALTDLLISKAGGDTKAAEQNTMETEMVAKHFKDYLDKSVRRMTLTIEWPEGSGTTSMTFSQLLVNYEADFAAGF